MTTPAPTQHPLVWQVVLHNAADFAQWQSEGFIGLPAVGWVHDLTGLTREEFIAKSHNWGGDIPYWRLCGEARDGERCVVIASKSGEVLGSGTLAGPYEYRAGEAYAHRRPTTWDADPVSGFLPKGYWKPKLKHVKQASLLAALSSQPVSATSAQAPKLDPTRRYWKLAPGKNAVAWPEWRDGGIAAIGWPELGDLSEATQAEFNARAADCAKKHGYSQGMFQVWRFRTIAPGDRIVANRGTRQVLGIGTVTSGYRFDPETHTVDGEDFAHQLEVVWDDTTERHVDETGSWQRTLLELSAPEFEALLAKKHVPGPCNPRNIILFGPPGTGKTYGTLSRALELILGPATLERLSDEQRATRFRQLQAGGQIEFVTFHQAYGYEEFVEGLRPVLDDTDGRDVRYELHAGAFKRIALRAAVHGLDPLDSTAGFEAAWDGLLEELGKKPGASVQSHAGKSYGLGVGSGGTVSVTSTDWSSACVLTREQARIYWQGHGSPDPSHTIRADLGFGKGPEAERGYNALGLVHKELRRIERSEVATPAESAATSLTRVQQALDESSEESGSFEFSEASPQYVLIIDEINRGNVGRILGELITLLEPDKRLGCPSELRLPLSYSPAHRFAVPPNLHVIGTMNTADRSIALMDVALRRRFTFEELMPDKDVIRTVLTGTKTAAPLVELVVDLFETLNARIRFLYDRDHQLGHAYFLGVTSLDGLRQVFVDRVVPLLQEYFYGAWDKVCLVLGCPYDDAGAAKGPAHLLTTMGTRRVYLSPLVQAEPFSAAQTGGLQDDDYGARLDFRLDSDFQRAGRSSAELARALLGVLRIENPVAFAARLAALTTETEGASGAPSDPDAD